MDMAYWSKAFRSFARNSRSKDFLRQVFTAGLRADAAPKALPVNFIRSYPEAKRQIVPMGDVRYRLWNMDPLEQYCLASLAGLRQPERIFEIGTFDGGTTLMLARMVPHARVYTLDLPPDHQDGINEVALARVDGAGSRFRDAPEGDRIAQLFGDSREFDFTPYYGKMDMVVVDGGHEADCVTADTENALNMVSPGGVVVWDDYSPQWIDVVKAVDDAARRRGVLVARLVNTEIALYDATRTKPADYVPVKKEWSRTAAG
jgi:predicted O-methyltransferase YrrM